MGRGMKRRIGNILIILLGLIGVILLGYPFVTKWLSDRDQTYVVQNYDDTLAGMTQQQMNEEWERAQVYNSALSTKTHVLYDPFASGQDAMDTEYLSVLNIAGDGMMCHIKIPKISVDLPVFHGVSAETLEKGVGHLEGSALPVGGEGTHAVLTGHTGLNSYKMFTDLTELTTGDEFYLYTLDRILAYRVDSILIVEPTDVGSLIAVPGRDYVTLVTCTPYGVNSHRLLVRGERVGYSPEEIQERIADTQPVTSRETWMLYAGIALLFLLGFGIFFAGRMKNRRKG